jgi:hypothetical protein
MRVGGILWGRRPPEGGGRPPRGGPPPAKTSLSIQKVFYCKWYEALKAETHGVERVHSLMCPYLARFCGRSRCFNRSVEMMVYSLQLRFFLKVNGDSWASILSWQSRGGLFGGFRRGGGIGVPRGCHQGR